MHLTNPMSLEDAEGYCARCNGWIKKDYVRAWYKGKQYHVLCYEQLKADEELV